MTTQPLRIQLADRSHEVRHQINRRLKHVYIQVRPEGIILKSPGISRKEALELLERQRSWLERKLGEIEPALESTALPGQFAFMGQEYVLKILADSSPGVLRLDHDQLIATLSLHEALCERQDLVLQAIDRFLLAEARSYMHDRLIYWSQRMGLAPSIIRFKRLTSRWGSCSAKDAINLNYRAIQLPPECIDAILVHELAHLRHLNHGAHFWRLVKSQIPDYDARDEVIRHWSRKLL